VRPRAPRSRLALTTPARSAPTDTAVGEVPILSVGELLGGLRRLLDERVGRVWVSGEISNLHFARSGHTYFTLKDAEAQVRAALFRGAARRLLFEPEDGLEVLVYADVEIYEARGDLQLIVRQLEPRGDGALRLAVEQLRRRLEAEGLFDPAHKRALPSSPRRIGIATSPTGAAVRDVIQVTGRRCPAIPLLVAPTRVQGLGAEREIAAAIDALGEQEDVDVILVIRGGGSLEDLQAFNTEEVAHAIARAPVPVVSGVGHEVDVSIADLVADQRAPTPSAAAELVAPDRESLRRMLDRDWRRLCRAADALLERAAARVDRGREAVAMLAPSVRLAAQRRRLEGLAHALTQAARSQAAQRERLAGLSRALLVGVRSRVARRDRVLALGHALRVAARSRVGTGRAALAERAARLEGLSPLAVLTRGYAVVRRARDGAVVRRADQLERGERLAIRLAEAELEAAVIDTRDRPRS